MLPFLKCAQTGRVVGKHSEAGEDLQHFGKIIFPVFSNELDSYHCVNIKRSCCTGCQCKPGGFEKQKI